MRGAAIAKVCLLFVLLAVMTAGSTSQSPETRKMGGFTAQVPTTPPPQPHAPPLPEGYRRIPMRIGVPIRVSASTRGPGARGREQRHALCGRSHRR